ncbi:MAG TPA: Stp1/IreP family PP2C-type Ser/Thr phosphatase [Nitrospira sp.]
MSMVQWLGVGRTETGHLRPTNQDAFTVMNDNHLWVVADGMGGHPGGDVAAQTAVASIARNSRRLFRIDAQNIEDPGRLIVDLLTAANQEIHEQASGQPALYGMGTTAVVMTIASEPKPTLYVAHLGDSRAYLYRDGVLTSLTRDHTLVEEYIQKGLINLTEARIHPKRHVLTQALGMELDARPDLTSVPLAQHDVLLLCTDGLTKMLTDDDIAFLLSKAENPVRACDDLIEQALARGGEDNVTVVVCASRAGSEQNGPLTTR